MADWHLWDGENQRGPLDRDELENRIRFHPNPGVVRVWRPGFPNWQTVQEAFDPSPRSPAQPPPLDTREEAAEAPKYRNFVARHWRGEYGLGVSYWVVGFCSNLFAITVILVIAEVAKDSFTPPVILTFFVSMWLCIAGLSVWQMIGTWRSANRRIVERNAMGKRAVWARVAKVAICLGWLQLASMVVKSAIPQIAEASRIAFLNDPEIPAYAIRVMNNGTEAEIGGGIKFGLTRDFENILNASGGVRTVHLDSVGGRVGEGQKLNALIRSRGLDTYVDLKCLSACTLAFAGGRQRILRKGAQLGFHRASFAGEDNVDNHGSSIERTVYSAAGISKTFIDRALATKNSDMWRPTEAELLSAGVVTRISTGDEFAIAGFGGKELSRDDWDKSLLKASPVYAALKDKYPKDYDEILDIFSKEAARGTPRAQLQGMARAKLSEFIKTLLPLADDPALIDFGRLVVDQYQAIQAQDETACYRFAAGVSVDEAIIRMIPADLGSRELALDARIILSTKPGRGKQDTAASWDKIRAKLAARGFSGADLKLLDSKTIEPSQYSRYCSLAIGLYQEITNLPAREAAPVLREVFS